MRTFLGQRRTRTAPLLALGVLACSAITGAQENAQEPERPPAVTLKAGVNLVQLDVTVRDKHNRLLTGLRKEAFQILEDGKPQPLSVASENELPLAIALLVDTSGSMSLTFDRLRDSALDALGALQPNDRVVVFAFTRRTERLTTLTSNHDEIRDALGDLRSRGGTDILDALWVASTYLKTHAPTDRRAIILVSDNISPKWAGHSKEEVEDTAIEYETDIHSIQVRNALSKMMGFSIGSKATGLNVGKLAEATGGELAKSSPEDVGDALRETLDRLRKRYTLGYAAPKENRPGSFHKIEVVLDKKYGKPRKDYVVACRRGYYTPQD